MNITEISSSRPIVFLLKKAEHAFFQGDHQRAAFLLDNVRAKREASPQQWMACGRLNEMLGRPEEALSDYAQALKLVPGNTEIILRRARILLELGRVGEAKREVKATLARGVTVDQVKLFLGDLLKRPCPPNDLSPVEIDRAFYQSKGRKKTIDRFLKLFRGRPGAYARQWFDPRSGKSGYFPVLEPLTPEVVEAHLQGKITVGVYLLDQAARVCFAALDLDLGRDTIAEIMKDPGGQKSMASAMRDLMAKILKASAELGLPVAFERSGYKGVHAWYFFETPVPAWAAKTLMMRLGEAVSPPPHGIQLEVFPKQVTLSGKGYGNLIKLPLGVHRVTGKKSIFLDEKGYPVEDSLNYLMEIKTIPAELVVSLASKLGAGEKGTVVLLPGTGIPRQVEVKASRAPQSSVSNSSKEAYARILEGCAMIRYLVRKAREFKHLSFDERKVVLGVLGHLPGGQKLVHHVISRCADYDPQITGHFISRMSRSPLGCRNIRRRLFYLQHTRCSCQFNLRGKGYPTPLLLVQQEGQ
ncbi:MAG: CRISPR-associated primase-polymerase type A1 [bacterium]